VRDVTQLTGPTTNCDGPTVGRVPLPATCAIVGAPIRAFLPPIVTHEKELNMTLNMRWTDTAISVLLMCGFAPSASGQSIPQLATLNDKLLAWASESKQMSELRWNRTWKGLKDEFVGKPIVIEGLSIDARDIEFDERSRESIAYVGCANSKDVANGCIHHTKWFAMRPTFFPYNDPAYTCSNADYKSRPCFYQGLRIVLHAPGDRLALEFSGRQRITLNGTVEGLEHAIAGKPGGMAGYGGEAYGTVVSVVTIRVKNWSMY